jgi:tetratricopeptide (TPR) repeat protein
MVFEQDLIRTRELLGESRIDAALDRLALAEQIADRTLHPEAADRAVASTSRLIDDHRAAGLFNEAQARFAEDDREGARTLLSQALELADDGAVAASCRHLLTIIDHPESLAGREIESVSPSPTPEEIDEFNRLIAAREFDRALQYLEGIRSGLGEAQQRWLDDRIAEIQRTIDYNRFVDAYNRAVDFYNQRRYDQAAKVLEEFLATEPENGEARAARALLDDALSAME